MRTHLVALESHVTFEAGEAVFSLQMKKKQIIIHWS